MRLHTYQPGYKRLIERCPYVLEINGLEASGAGFDESYLTRAIRQRYAAVSWQYLLRHASGLIFVTNELAHAAVFAKSKAARTVVPNGIDLSAHPELAPPTPGLAPRLICISSPLTPWMGVDRLMSFARIRPEWRFDLIGWTDTQLGQDVPDNVTCHGVLRPDQVLPLMRRAHVGIGPLAPERSSITETCSLKVRQYLAYGLPVILAGTDTDFPLGAPFLCQLGLGDDNTLSAMRTVDAFVALHVRDRVPRAAVAHLDVVEKEKTRLAFLSEVAAHPSTRPP